MRPNPGICLLAAATWLCPRGAVADSVDVGTASTAGGATPARQYCIIGAGPAGIQLGHFFRHAGRDYVIYERNRSAGSFFAKFPRHRSLISLNKRFVREGRGADFAFRHDWNSLLDVREEANRTRPVTERSDRLFPQADVLYRYLGDFAKEQSDAIQYGVAVTLVQRAPDGNGFDLTLESSLEGRLKRKQVEAVRCQEVIVATGFWKPRGAKTRIDGAEYVEGYESLPETGEKFAGKSVIVLGLGNAALETVQEIQQHAAEVHLLARQRPLPEGGKGVRFAYQTHYVGDIRAGRTTILDTYLLKSLDTFDFTALNGLRRLAIIPCNGTRLCIWSVERNDCRDEQCWTEFTTGGQGLNYRLPIAKWLKGSRLGERVRGILGRHAPPPGPTAGWEINPAWLQEHEQDLGSEERQLTPEMRRLRRERLGIREEVFGDEYEELLVSSVLLRERPELMDALVPVRASSSDNLRYPMDHVIRCFGWAMDQSLFHGTLQVNTTHHGKYPKITPTYQAEGIPGLYFAGTLTHGLDFRKSAGGFIHGFRYTARALFRWLEQKNFGVPWPQQTFWLELKDGQSQGMSHLAKRLQERINDASGPYQMFQSLGDMVLFERNTSTGLWSATYLEEVPLREFDRRFQHLPRLVWSFRYGDHLYGPVVLDGHRVGSTNPYTAEKSAFLHPQLSYYPAGSEQPALRHWLMEDIFTHWAAAELYTPLARFVGHATAAATGDAKFSKKEAIQMDITTGEATGMLDSDLSTATCTQQRSATPL